MLPVTEMPKLDKAQKRELQRFKYRYGPKVQNKRLGLLYMEAGQKRFEEIKKKRAKKV